MECNDVVEQAVGRLSSPATPAESVELDRHLAGCPDCRRQLEEAETVWARLGADADTPLDPEFARETLAMLQAETLRRRVARFPRRRFAAALRVAALLAAGASGFLLSRAMPTNGPAAQSAAVSPGKASGSPLPDLTRQPKLTNVAFQPADSSGRVGVSFDATARYTVVGKPGEKSLSDLLAYLVAGGAGTEGARGRAIDLVSQHYAEGAPASPQIVETLVQTLRKDENPGVRKKAAEALSQLPATPQIRDAFLGALRSDACPAVRIVAVESLAKVALTLRDPAAIETLRQKASDERETGYVRVKAASALKRIDL
ncbi:MAG: HEAT repeat domain-containing protein [Thermoanaerobaculia bacterium]